VEFFAAFEIEGLNWRGKEVTRVEELVHLGLSFGNIGASQHF
jgi:hypothetical protein